MFGVHQVHRGVRSENPLEPIQIPQIGPTKTIYLISTMFGAQ